MFHLLSLRELGIVTPQTTVQLETDRRFRCVQLSKYTDLESVHSSGINSLDIDLVEQRYLLSGATNGIVTIHDLNIVPSAADAIQQTYPVACSVPLGSGSRHKGSIAAIQWYPIDTGMFVSSGMDKFVKVWDTNTMQSVSNFEFKEDIYGHHMSMIATRHSLVAVAGGTSGVKLLNLKSGSTTHTLRVPHDKKAAHGVQWSPREEFILANSGTNGQLLLWDIRFARGCIKVFDQHNGDTSAGPQSECTAHGGRIIGLRFLPDGLRLLSLGSDLRLRLWDVMSGRNTLVNYGRIDVVGRVAVQLATSPLDSSRPLVFVPSGSDVVVFDANYGRRVDVLRGHYSRVNCAVVDSAAQVLFTGANDHAILVWTPGGDERRAVMTTPRHSSEVASIQQGSGLGRFARRVGGGMADAWSSDEDG